MKNESITLYYREGSSDKVYQAAIEEKNGGFVVNFAFGRRGSTLQTGTKTASPVSFEEAKRVYDKLVASKVGKGYTPGADGTPYAQTEEAGRVSGFLPQLCNPVREDEVACILPDKSYWMEEKFDGKRMLLRKEGQNVVGINRKGLVVALPQPLIMAAQKYDESFLLDGECVGETLHVFDLLLLNGEKMVGLAMCERRHTLEELLQIDDPHLLLVETEKSVAGKAEKFTYFKAMRKEGVVFKRYNAPYAPGRPANGSGWFKHKFVTSGSFIVSRVNADRRSVGLEVFEERKRIGVGNVTIPVNAEVPIVGDIIEVRYLYAYRGGSLFQPVYLGPRDDLSLLDCTVRELKYRAEDSEEEA